MKSPRFASLAGSATAITLGIKLFSTAAVGAATNSVNWPSFRGPQAGGVADGFATPERWNVEARDQIRWSASVPGLGHSCPIIWGDRVFVTTAVKDGDAELKVGLYGDIWPVNEAARHRWLLLAFDKPTGRKLWEKVGHEAMPRIKRHPKASHCNSTPATDGRYIVTFFGSEGLFCFDFDGRLLWKKDLGPLDAGYYAAPTAQWGFGSSPVIQGDRVIVLCDVQTNSFLAAFALSDGQELWRTPRNDVPTWGSPTVDLSGGRGQILVNGFRHSGGYDLDTGHERWRFKGGGDIPVPTPVVAHGLVFLTSAHGRRAPIRAIRLTATGDITLTADAGTNQYVAWNLNSRGNYMQTPLVVGDHLYCCNDAGVLTGYEARTGRRLFSERLGSGGQGFTASGVAADGRLYFPSEIGNVYVLKAGPTFQPLATNSLGETCLATPAISAGTIFFRTRHQLLAVGKPH